MKWCFGQTMNSNKQLSKLKQDIADIREYLSTDLCCQCEKAKAKLDSLIHELNNRISQENTFVADHD
jgi:hypothetical protein